MQMLRLTLVLALAAFGMASSSVQPVCGQGQGATCSSGGPLSGVAGTVKERSFYCIKPDGLQRGLVGEIISRFEKKGLQLVGMKLVSPTEELVAEHYSEHKGKVFFDGLVKYFSSGPVIAMVWQGPEVVATGRKLLGKTNPLEADLGTIRGDFGLSDSRNLVHASDSPEAATREIGLWFEPGEVADWGRSAEDWFTGSNV